jgi:hypothetical protein
MRRKKWLWLGFAALCATACLIWINLPVRFDKEGWQRERSQGPFSQRERTVNSAAPGKISAPVTDRLYGAWISIESTRPKIGLVFGPGRVTQYRNVLKHERVEGGPIVVAGSSLWPIQTRACDFQAGKILFTLRDDPGDVGLIESEPYRLSADGEIVDVGGAGDYNGVPFGKYRQLKR